MIRKILMGAISIASLVAVQANACTSISVENVNGAFVTSQKTGMIPFKVSVFCANPENANISARLIHSSATGNMNELNLYKDGIVSDDENKILKLNILDHTFRDFQTKSISFNAGESKTDLDLYISIPNFKKNEPGNYSGVINFDVEY